MDSSNVDAVFIAGEVRKWRGSLVGVDVPLRTLFEARTIAVFAERVAELSHGAREDREEIEL